MTPIVFLITKSEVGGAQRFVREQIAILAQTDQYRLYLVTNQPGWLVETTIGDVAGVWTDRRLERPTSLGYLLALTQYLRRVGAGLVVCNSAYAGVYGRLAARWLKIPAVYVSHGWSSVYRGGRTAGLLNAIERQLARLSAAVWCVSDNDYAVARQRIGIPAPKLLTVSNAIFAPTDHATVPALQADERFRVVTVTRLTFPQKRVDLLIEAVAGMSDVDLFVVGTGAHRSRIEAQVQARNAPNVKLLGEIPNFNGFGEYHAFALISDGEGLPLSALEALAHGLPVVVSDVGGCPALVADCGALVQNDVAAIQAGIAACRQHHAAYARAARQHFESHFDLTRRAGEFLGIYEGIVGNGRLGSSRVAEREA
jgi:glycosyltransferase involved in cell wall biosynthesis